MDVSIYLFILGGWRLRGVLRGHCWFICWEGRVESKPSMLRLLIFLIQNILGNIHSRNLTFNNQKYCGWQIMMQTVWNQMYPWVLTHDATRVVFDKKYSFKMLRFLPSAWSLCERKFPRSINSNDWQPSPMAFCGVSAINKYRCEYITPPTWTAVGLTFSTQLFIQHWICADMFTALYGLKGYIHFLW